MTLNDLKKHLIVDFDDDDGLIQAYMGAAIDYIQQTTGKTYDPAKEVWNLAIKILVKHWYDRREVELDGRLAKVSFSIDALINHISMCGDYE